MNKTVTIIIAGGKTGGHLFPGIAVAQAIERINPDAKILFVGTSAPFEINTLEKYGYLHKSIFSKPVKGGNLFSKAFSTSVILFSIIQSMCIMKNFKPDFVLGVGGFSSFAVVVSAWILRIPTAIQEQNAFPGLTNRLLSRFAKTIFTSFEDTKGFYNNPKTKYVGNPVRKTNTVVQAERLNSNNFDSKKVTILVTGGSQGATSINMAFTDALKLMNDPSRFNIIHQTGLKDEKEMLEKYKTMGIKATIKAFFHDMPQIQDEADLIITRAGAGAISELCIKGLPAILIPFPHAADDHQTHNAAALEKKNAAVMIKEKNLTGEKLKNTMKELIENKKLRARMVENLKRLSMADADKKIADFILKTKDMEV